MARKTQPTNARLTSAIAWVTAFCHEFSTMEKLEAATPEVWAQWRANIKLLRDNPLRTRKLFLNSQLECADDCACAIWAHLSDADEFLQAEQLACYGAVGPMTNIDLCEHVILPYAESMGWTDELTEILARDVAEVLSDEPKLLEAYSQFQAAQHVQL